MRNLYYKYYNIYSMLITNIFTKTLIVAYIGALLMVILLYILNITDSLANNLYGVLCLGFIPVVGGINGLIMAKRWGFLKSAIGKAMVFLSLGLISWGLGTYIFSGVYNFLLNIEVPYPSFADIGYILSLPLWMMGMYQLSRATGAKYGLRSSKGKGVLLIIPVAVTLLSYYLLVVVARGISPLYSATSKSLLSFFDIGYLALGSNGLLKLFFDLAYPIGDVIILTLVTLIYGLSYRYFGGVYKKAIYLVLFGFILMYFADFSFSYTTTLETFHPADWVDLLFTTAMFVLSMGVIMFDPKKLEVE